MHVPCLKPEAKTHLCIRHRFRQCNSAKQPFLDSCAVLPMLSIQAAIGGKPKLPLKVGQISVHDFQSV
jgi:hypothetical protein